LRAAAEQDEGGGEVCQALALLKHFLTVLEGEVRKILIKQVLHMYRYIIVIYIYNYIVCNYMYIYIVVVIVIVVVAVL
jgi:hypothetical protein